MKNRNRKGMTLVEIIVSIGLLGLIAVGFLTALTGYVRYISNTKIITQDIFQAQEELELDIQELKARIRTGFVTGYTEATYEVFGQSLTGYQLSAKAEQHELDTVVGSGLQLEFAVPRVEHIETVLFRTTEINGTYAYGTAVNGVALRAVGSYQIAGLPSEPSFMNKIQWYVTREGFNIPLTELPGEIEIGSRYPRFPEDYEPIPNASGLTLDGLESYIGHHVVFTVTPVAKTLRMGSMANSAPLYVSGPPVLTNLRLHLDPSMISRDDPLSIRLDTSDPLETIWRVLDWPNLAKALGSTVPSAKQPTAALQPRLDDVSYIDETFPGIWGRQVSSTETGSGMSVATFAPSGLNNRELTVILVAKADTTLTAGAVIQGTNWEIGRSSAGSALGITLTTASGTDRAEVPAADLGLDGEWHVLTGVLNIGSSTSTLKFQIDKDEYTTSFANSRVIQTDSIAIRTTGIAIGELMVFDRDLSLSGDLESIKTWLFEKYKPEITPWTIRQLYPISGQIELGGTYLMPSSVSARLMDGTKMNVAVDWSPSAVDTTTPGFHTFTGSAQVDPAKTTVLTVNVIGIDHFLPQTKTAYLSPGGRFDLPAEADAVFQDGVTRATAVVWETAHVDLSRVGTVTVHGTSAYDLTVPVDFQVNVLPNPVTGITLSKDTLYLANPNSATLTATVLPASAPDKSVAWSSDNPAVTVVNGVISTSLPADTSGTAIITATSVVNPGVSASCTIYVNERAELSGVDAWQRKNSNDPTEIILAYNSTTGKYSGTVTVGNTAYYKVSPVPSDASFSTTNTSSSPAGLLLDTFNKINRNSTHTITVTVNAPGHIPTVYTIEIRRN